ncbi:MAG TPA: alkaline phosphatase family protein [Gaiellales bacterium]|nr:alkaline phosphatase family protein [Gaiellales bacterium]
MWRKLAVFASLAAATALSPAAPAAQNGGAVSLVVVVVVDQMRADYLTTFASRWHGGFRTLLTQGADFANAEYPYWSTITCAGHTSIATGTLPRTHGMILNRWWDRGERRVITCNDDLDVTAVSYQRPAVSNASARRMLVTTLADELRAQKPGARVVSLSLKPRSAIGLAGHGGDAVVWFDEPSRSFVTSTAFAPAPVPDVARFFADDSFEAEQHREWQLAAPADSYQYGDALPGERPDRGWTTLFPHRIAGGAGVDAVFADHWQKSPLSDAYLGRLAARLIDRWQLGQRGTTDFLGVSFSALDMVGHDFGPRSREVEDILINLDATIGALIEHLDRSVGRDRYLLALTSDHGVAVIPEQHGAGRIANEDLGAVVEQALVQTWGAPSQGTYVAASLGGQIYFAEGLFDRWRMSPAAVRAVELALREVPGLTRVVRRDQIDRGDAVTQAIARGFVADRSGDLFLVPQRDWILEQRVDGDATTHGTMHDYDTRVPLLLLGAGVRPGRSTEAVTPLDIAPTLARAAGVTLSGRDGRSLLP